jgi:hypothetical protein
MRLPNVTLVRRAVGAVTTALLTVAACSGNSASGGREPGDNSSLTSREHLLALAVARHEAQADEASITSATAMATHGRLSEPETRRACGAGRLLSIELIGTFPHIVTTGHPVLAGEMTAADDFTVHAVLLTVDARNGSVCLKGVATGKVDPEPGSMELRL